jgi:hypothetical protein
MDLCFQRLALLLVKVVNTLLGDLNMNYYTNQRAKLMKGFEKAFRCAEEPILKHFNNDQTTAIHEHARAIFSDMIPKLPYIGGKKLPGTQNLIGSAQLLAIIRALESAGLSRNEIGETVYKILENTFERIPRFLGRVMGRIMLSSAFIKKRQALMERTQKREYPEAFVTVYAPSKDGSYDFGQDVMECAVHKFYRAQDALEYLPYICLGDYPMFRRMGVRFYRTQTLGNGGDLCDFRFSRQGETMRGWPPEPLPEWRG